MEWFSFQLEEHITIAAWLDCILSFDPLIDFTAPGCPPGRWRFFGERFKLEPVDYVLSLLELALNMLNLPFEGVRIGTMAIKNPISENKFISYEHDHHASLNVVPKVLNWPVFIYYLPGYKKSVVRKFISNFVKENLYWIRNFRPFRSMKERLNNSICSWRFMVRAANG